MEGFIDDPEGDPMHTSNAANEPPVESVEASPLAEVAHAVGLRYVSDQSRGFGRVPEGDGFVYLDLNGKRLSDKSALERIQALVIPPAWTRVWICPHENGHIQATGRDVRGRKQYRYHDRWRETRDQSKYSRMLEFGRLIPQIRCRINHDLRRHGMPREKVLAIVVRLLETTLIRVGNDEYAQTNQSYGLTTLHNRHAKVNGSTVTFQFVGKSRKAHRIDLRDPYLAKMVRRCQELPGQELFGYVDEAGAVRDITSEDVNAYLREITHAEITAKDFRTWAGTVLAGVALGEFEAFASAREARRNISTVIKAVAKMLGNTPAICRKCYIHPVVLESYLSGKPWPKPASASEQKDFGGQLRPEERAILRLLRLAESGG